MRKEIAIHNLYALKQRTRALSNHEALDMAIKALEQEDVLDKIRAEIEQITDTMGVSYNQYVSKIDVLQIIDKYNAEE